MLPYLDKHSLLLGNTLRIADLLVKLVLTFDKQTFNLCWMQIFNAECLSKGCFLCFLKKLGQGNKFSLCLNGVKFFRKSDNLRKCAIQLLDTFTFKHFGVWFSIAEQTDVAFGTVAVLGTDTFNIFSILDPLKSLINHQFFLSFVLRSRAYTSIRLLLHVLINWHWLSWFIICKVFSLITIFLKQIQRFNCTLTNLSVAP